MELNNFVIQKNRDKKTDKHPSHRIVCKEGEAWVEWGSCWTRTNKNGEAYLSCAKKKPLAPRKPEDPVEYPKEQNETDKIPF